MLLEKELLITNMNIAYFVACLDKIQSFQLNLRLLLLQLHKHVLKFASHTTTTYDYKIHVQ